jgi:hypothetical protein
MRRFGLFSGTTPPYHRIRRAASLIEVCSPLCGNYSSNLLALGEDKKMRMPGLFAVSVVALLLGGCETTSPAQQRAADESRCRSYGFRRGTDAFSKCLLDVDLDRAADRRSRRDDVLVYGRPGLYGPPYWRYW